MQKSSFTEFELKIIVTGLDQPSGAMALGAAGGCEVGAAAQLRIGLPLAACYLRFSWSLPSVVLPVTRR